MSQSVDIFPMIGPGNLESCHKFNRFDYKYDKFLVTTKSEQSKTDAERILQTYKSLTLSPDTRIRGRL